MISLLKKYLCFPCQKWKRKRLERNDRIERENTINEIRKEMDAYYTMI